MSPLEEIFSGEAQNVSDAAPFSWTIGHKAIDNPVSRQHHASMRSLGLSRSGISGRIPRLFMGKCNASKARQEASVYANTNTNVGLCYSKYN